MTTLVRSFTLAAFAVLALSVSACGSKAEIGGECETSGSIDECVDGAICDKTGDMAMCKKSCTDQTQCAADEECNGVSGAAGGGKACKKK